MSAFSDIDTQPKLSMEPRPHYPGTPAAFGLALATIHKGQVFDLLFPFTNVGQNPGSATLFWNALQDSNTGVSGEIDLENLMAAHDAFEDMFEGQRRGASFYKKHANIAALDQLIDSVALGEHPLSDFGYRYGVVLAWSQDFDKAPANRADAWLRLTLMSERKKVPNSMNLTGLFGKMANLIWTDKGPVAASTSAWQLNQMGATAKFVDKFPLMLEYVIPSGVRIAIGADVRLGAHLAVGTVVMFDGSVNFNAGTLDRRSKAKRKPKNKGCMIEGSIAQGVTVGDGTQIGRGGGEIGTLTNVGGLVNSVGQDCLIGALAEVGIPLGDNVAVASGLALMPGTRVVRIFTDKSESDVMKAVELQGLSNIVYLQNSENGRVEARDLPRGKSAVKTNAELHAA